MEPREIALIVWMVMVFGIGLVHYAVPARLERLTLVLWSVSIGSGALLPGVSWLLRAGFLIIAAGRLCQLALMLHRGLPYTNRDMDEPGSPYKDR